MAKTLISNLSGVRLSKDAQEIPAYYSVNSDASNCIILLPLSKWQNARVAMKMICFWKSISIFILCAEPDTGLQDLSCVWTKAKNTNTW